MSGFSPFARDAECGRLAALRPVLESRAAMLAEIRAFFAASGFLEVETPVRIPAPALEMHIEPFPAEGAFLRTSPELHMKRLLAAGYDRIFQMGPCFRRGEKGRLHRQEFAMLEWYRASADYMDALADARGLLRAVMKNVLRRNWLQFRGTRVQPDEWLVLTVRDCFAQWAGWDPVRAYDAGRFDEDMVNKIEPELPRDRSVILKDYPAEAAAFARLAPDNPRIAERWELYVGGIEIANAFSELTDYHEQMRRFEECARMRRDAGLPDCPLDGEFLAAMRSGLPAAAGVALGLDRLLMLLSEADSLDSILPFDAV